MRHDRSYAPGHDLRNAQLAEMAFEPSSLDAPCPVSGQQLGISQMQVSRLLGRALGYLRPRLLGLDEATLR